MSRRRLLIVTPSLAGGGAEHHLVRLLPILTASFDVHLATLKKGDALKKDVPPSVTLHHIGSRRWLVGAARLRALISAIRPAFAIGVQEASSVPLLLATRLLGRHNRPRVVLSIQTTLSVVLERSTPRTRFLLRQAIRRLYPSADRIVAVSQGVADDVLAIAPHLAPRVTTIPNASVMPSVAALGREPCSHPFLLDRATPVLIACGRLNEPKDYPTMLQVVARVAERRPVRLIVLGDGVLRPQLEALAAALGITNLVSFNGYTANPYAYLSRSTMFLLTSRWEGFPNVVAEALACGLPVVATDCPHGPSEILDHGRFGRLVPPGDVDAISGAILGLLEDPATMEDFARRAPSRAELYTVERSAREHVAVLEGF
jgi:glycosyltransferase involved in cell wall biosynthesis